MAQTAQTSMAMNYLNALAYYNVPEDGEEGEDGRERRFAVDNEEGDVVDLEAVCQVADACSTSIGVGDDNDLVAAINEFLEVVRMQRGMSACRSISRWTAGTCDSLLRLRLIRQVCIRSDVARTGLRVEVVADHAVVCKLKGPGRAGRFGDARNVVRHGGDVRD
jgi:hypothetical protein